MREMYCGYVTLWMLYSEWGDCNRKKRKLQRVCCRLYPFILLDNKNGGLDNFSSGRNPYWVNHVYLCLYCIVYLLCFIYAFVLFYCRSCFSNNKMGFIIYNPMYINEFYCINHCIPYIKLVSMYQSNAQHILNRFHCIHSNV